MPAKFQELVKCDDVKQKLNRPFDKFCLELVCFVLLCIIYRSCLD
jgi:hypothetical protein